MKSTDKEDLMSYRLSDLFKSNYRTESQLAPNTENVGLDNVDTSDAEDESWAIPVQPLLLSLDGII
jgi:hypothetical protein